MPSLNLRGVPVSSKATKTRQQRALEILDDIQRQVKAMGLPEYPEPTTRPTPLSEIDIGSLTNREIETHLVAYTAFATYILPKLAQAEAAYKISALSLKHLAASLKVSLFKDKTARAEVDALVHTSPEYVEYELEHLKLFATKEIVGAHYKAYSKQAQALSRLVEMRKLEFEQEHRATNVGNFKQRPAGQMPGRLRGRP